MSLKKTVALIAIAVLGATMVALAPCTTLADDEAAFLGGLRLTEINATPARVGETTILTFAIENLGIDPVRITGARLRDGAPSRVMGSFGSLASGEMDAMRVDPHASARLDGDSAWIEVGPLAQDLEPNTVVEGFLLLGTYEAPVTVHIGPFATLGRAHKHLVRARSSEQGSTGC